MAFHKKADRAKLFAPFDALKGFREALADQERIVVPKIELSEDYCELLDREFQKLKIRDIVTIIYYDKCEYLSKTGMISKINLPGRLIQIVQTPIYIDNIFSIQCH